MSSILRELIESFVPYTAHAEEPEDDVEDAEEEEEEEEDEDEDDEDEEAEDQLDKLKKECTDSAKCKPYLHHFQECVERVQKQQEEPGYAELEYKEDCVEEFFHLQHCVNDCAAPRLFYRLK